MPGNISAKSVPGLGPSSDTKVLSGHQDCPPTQESQLQDQQISRRKRGMFEILFVMLTHQQEDLGSPNWRMPTYP